MRLIQNPGQVKEGSRLSHLRASFTIGVTTALYEPPSVRFSAPTAKSSRHRRANNEPPLHFVTCGGCYLLARIGTFRPSDSLGYVISGRTILLKFIENVFFSADRLLLSRPLFEGRPSAD